MSGEVSNNSGRMGFLGFLTLLFVAAKLFGAIAWSWWWVFSPIWIPALIVILAVLIAVMATITPR